MTFVHCLSHEGSGAPNGRGPRFLELAEPAIATPLIVHTNTQALPRNKSRGWRVGKSPLNLSITDLRSYLSYITYHRLICICMPESPSSTQRSKLTAVSN